MNMKRKVYLLTLASLMLLTAGTMVTSCSSGDDGETEEPLDFEVEKGYGYSFSSMMDGTGDGGGPTGGAPTGNGGNTQAGVVTAGEWNDLANWPYWAKLMLSEDYGNKSDYWSCFTNNRIPIEVLDGSKKPVAGAHVKLVRTGDTSEPIWEAVTDNHGQANLWLSLWQKTENPDLTDLRVSIEGKVMDGQPKAYTWESALQEVVNRYTVTSLSYTVKQQADIAFVVDATGSMADEIGFLKSDLLDILNKAAALRPSQTFRTAALFYRDRGDEYLTRHSDFTTNKGTTVDFVSEQEANGGGDYPEAVHTALEQTLQSLSWDEQARTRLAFLILDAPAHHETDVIASLQQSITSCARQGIKLIPVAASGTDKNTEFMLRFFAVVTGGTYVFLTDDSGVGNAHITPTVGDYDVEQLNNLIIRLIDHYTE